MDLSIVPVMQPLEVEGQSNLEGVGEFKGQVLVMALRGGDPVAEAVPDGQGTGALEGLLGWGVTYFLVADVRKPAPVWVSKADVEKHRLGRS